DEYYWYEFDTYPLCIKTNDNEIKTILKFGKLKLSILNKYNNIITTANLQINVANDIHYISDKKNYISVEKFDDEYQLKDKQISQLWKAEFINDNYRLRSLISRQEQIMYCIGKDLKIWQLTNYFWNLERVDFIDE
ncbi:14183_t:CDS:2, partial [Dentiscutata erythropus]